MSAHEKCAFSIIKAVETKWNLETQTDEFLITAWLYSQNMCLPFQTPENYLQESEIQDWIQKEEIDKLLEDTFFPPHFKGKIETLIKTKAKKTTPPPQELLVLPRNINTCNTIYAQGARFTEVTLCLYGRILHFGEGKVNSLHFLHLSKIIFEGERRRLQWGWTISTSHCPRAIPTSRQPLKPSARHPGASKKLHQSRWVGREHNSMGNFLNWLKMAFTGHFLMCFPKNTAHFYRIQSMTMITVLI